MCLTTPRPIPHVYRINDPAHNLDKLLAIIRVFTLEAGRSISGADRWDRSACVRARVESRRCGARAAGRIGHRYPAAAPPELALMADMEAADLME